MTAVAVVGTAMLPVRKYLDRTVADLGWPVVKAAIEDAGIDRSKIQAAYCGSVFAGGLIGQRILRPLGMLPLPVVNCSNACSSGGTAFREAYAAISSGEYDVALVIGIDKLTDLGGGILPGQKEDCDTAIGMVMPALYAMRARRYMHDYGVSAEQLAKVAVKAHRHGAKNPFAQMRNEISVQDVQSARPIADPFTLYHCCPIGDCAAAVVLASEAFVRKNGLRPVWVKSAHLTSGKYMAGGRDMTKPEITIRGIKEVYEETGLSPDDIDVAEIHDAFTVAELMYYEALGFCDFGEGVRLLEAGETSLGGRIPVNPSGGLLSKGHPVGATGVIQIVDIVKQLRGEAGDMQVENARIGMTHCTGGGIAGLDHGACAINIFEAR